MWSGDVALFHGKHDKLVETLNYDEIEKSAVTYALLAPGRQSSSEIVDVCGALKELGFRHGIFILPNIHEIEPLCILGEEVISQVA